MNELTPGLLATLAANASRIDLLGLVEERPVLRTLPKADAIRVGALAHILSGIQARDEQLAQRGVDLAMAHTGLTGVLSSLERIDHINEARAAGVKDLRSLRRHARLQPLQALGALTLLHALRSPINRAMEGKEVAPWRR